MQFKVFTPTEYTEILNEGLSDFAAVIEGEVSEYRINQGKWIFFKIKDAGSVLDCFSTTFQIKTPLEDGMQVRLYGVPKIYPKSGKLSLTVQWVEASGEGALKRAFELLKEELEREGLFSLSRKREITKFPNKIGLIASKESAAYKDFLKIISQRFPIEISLFDVSVQGENSISDIVSAFEYFNEHKDELDLDLIVLTRGGGSLEDLKSFNSREIAYAVFASLLPVVCGVGHEQDVSLADYVADLRASTPSNAAELISPQRYDVLDALEHKASKMEAILKSSIPQKDQVDHKAYRIEVDLRDLVSSSKANIESGLGGLEDFIYEKINSFKSLEVQLKNCLKIFEESLIMQKTKMENFVRLLNGLSPQAVLKRGYSITKLNGRVVSSVKKLKRGDKLNTQLSDGEIVSEVLVD